MIGDMIGGLNGICDQSPNPSCRLQRVSARRQSQHGFRLPATEMQVQRASMPCAAQPLHAGERLPLDEGLESRLE
jgi:hypothetical protein